MSDTQRIPAFILWVGETIQEAFERGRTDLLEQFSRHIREEDFNSSLQNLQGERKDIIVLVDRGSPGAAELEGPAQFVGKVWHFYRRFTEQSVIIVLTSPENEASFRERFEQVDSGFSPAEQARNIYPRFIFDPAELLEWAREKFQ